MSQKTAVVILNWNGEEFLKKFLPSVVNFTDKKLADIVVIDNGSSDNSINLLQDQFSIVKTIKLDKNYGFTGGYNKGLALLKGYEYFLLLNSDVEVSEGYLEPLIEMLDSDKNIAAVQPKILSYENKQNFEYAGAAGGLIDMFGFPYCRGRILSRVEKDLGQYNDACEVFWASGAAVLVRSDLYLEFGGLDEDYFAHMEEIDLAWRLKNSGYKIMVEPKSTIYHLGGGTLPNNSPKKLFLNFRNSLFTLYKNLPSHKLFIIIYLRMCLDGCIAMVYLLQGKFSYFSAVLKAHFAFYGNLKVLRQKRKSIKISKTPLGPIHKGFVGFIR
ncbi:MAG: glycosyltransferase family 2 protein [Rikenellaceae bacterium]